MKSVPEGDEVGPSSSILPEPFQEEQTMLILVGLIAAGKSTFAGALESHFPRFRRCNQDDLGNRQRVEELAYHTLREGRSPCIDRTNFNATQRSYWSTIARSFPGTSISIIVFDTPYHVCVSRLQQRTAHPTIRDAQHGVEILQKFASDFELPSSGEAYDHIIYLRPEDHRHPEYARDDILSILKRLKASTRDAGIRITRCTSGEARFGRGKRTDRARGYHHGGASPGGRGFPPARGTLHGSSRLISGRVGGPSNPGWGRRLGPSAAAEREPSDEQSAVAADVPPKEGSKGSDTAAERHNSS